MALGRAVWVNEMPKSFALGFGDEALVPLLPVLGTCELGRGVRRHFDRW